MNAEQKSPEWKETLSTKKPSHWDVLQRVFLQLSGLFSLVLWGCCWRNWQRNKNKSVLAAVHLLCLLWSILGQWIEPTGSFKINQCHPWIGSSTTNYNRNEIIISLLFTIWTMNRTFCTKLSLNLQKNPSNLICMHDETLRTLLPDLSGFSFYY